MQPKIEGHYKSGDDAVQIRRARQTNWQTAYSAGDSKWQQLPVFTQEYIVDLPHECIGIAQFDGKQLRGHFHPKALAQLLNGIVRIENLPDGPLLSGQFIATLREDDNFYVVIEQFDGRNDPGTSKPPKPMPGEPPSMFEPEMEHIETVWVRQ